MNEQIEIESLKKQLEEMHKQLAEKDMWIYEQKKNIEEFEKESEIELNTPSSIKVPKEYVFTTLPLISHIGTSKHDTNKEIIRYVGGQSFHRSIKNALNETSYHHIYLKSILIFDISMAIYVASKAGIGFNMFTCRDIIFRNGLFCLKTYKHAIPISNDFTVLDSFRKFCYFYRMLTIADRAMIGQYEYISLNIIEDIVFHRTQRSQLESGVMSDGNWLQLFKDTKKEYRSIVIDDRRQCHKDPTWFLLENLIATLESQTLSEKVNEPGINERVEHSNTI